MFSDSLGGVESLSDFCSESIKGKVYRKMLPRRERNEISIRETCYAKRCLAESL